MRKSAWPRRPSPALIVSLMALVLAMGGFAAAAIPDRTGTIHGCYKKKKGTLRLVSGSKCKKSEKSISWNQKGANGASGAAGAKGDKGDAGADGSAVAYAHVNSDGTLDTSLSKNITSAQVAKTGSSGAYCFRNLSFTPKSAVATVQYDGGPPVEKAQVTIFPNGFTDCGAFTGSQVEVTTSNASSYIDLSFYIVFN
jgi:hypothetical protein